MLLQLFVSGLQAGAVYGLIGLGYATVLNATGIVNFAQGDFLMVAALILAVLSTLQGLPYALAVVLSLGLVSIIGAVSDYVLIRPLRRRHASLFSMTMVMVGAMIVLEQGAALIFGKRELPVNSPLPTSSIQLGAQTYVQPQGLLLLVVVVMTFIALYTFYHHTSLGKQMYAVGIDIEAARAIGIDTLRANAVAFALGGLVAGVGGVLFAPIVGASWQMGLPLTIKGFVAMVVGGAARLEGPLLGGAVLGLAEVFAYSWISPAYGSALALIVLLVVLIVRPSGLLGT
jgi:branched-chain amino acid transport system permease protein